MSTTKEAQLVGSEPNFSRITFEFRQILNIGPNLDRNFQLISESDKKAALHKMYAEIDAFDTLNSNKQLN